MPDLISSHVDILGGKPVISGTRIPIDLIFELLHHGVSIHEILEDKFSKLD